MRDGLLFLPMHIGPVRHMVPHQPPVQVPADTAILMAKLAAVEVG